MLANTADTGSLEYNTVDGTLWFRHALGATSTPPATPTSAPSSRRSSSRSSCAHSQGPATASASTRPTACSGRGRGAGADVDGRADRRRAGDARAGQAGRGERALDPRARRRRARSPATPTRAQRFDGSRRARAGVVPGSVRPRADGGGLLRRRRRPSDATLRPNQLLAVSLPDAPLAGDEARGPRVDAVPAALLTPLGLRSLAPGEPGYTPCTAAARPTATAPTTRGRSGRG
jgi:hypothetical protein